jgi:hypothetical protein
VFWVSCILMGKVVNSVDGGGLERVEERVLLDLNVYVSSRDGAACLELRRVVCDLDVVKKLVSCAYNHVPIVIQPVFTRPLDAIGDLKRKGLLYVDKDDRLRWVL